jgi:hypothetical protein
VLGLEHPDTIACIANLALTYTNQSRLNETEKLEVQTLELIKRVLGEEHPKTQNNMNKSCMYIERSASR